MAEAIEFVLQTFGADLREVAPKAEAAGFDAIAVADHPGATWSPFVALTTAATSTEQLRLQTAVVNCGVREPLDLAEDVATLQNISGGRVVLGVGAGHTPDEWAQIGRERPAPSGRIDRFEEVVRSTMALLRGETVTLDGKHVTLHDAGLHMELPEPPPLLFGGGNRRLIHLGCEFAEYIELGGIGRTLPDGHMHEPRWSSADTDASVEVFEKGCEVAGRRPVLGSLVQQVHLSDDAEGSAREFLDSAREVLPAEMLPRVDDLLECPYILIGTTDEIIAKVERLRERWGFTRYTVRAIEPLVEVMAALR